MDVTVSSRHVELSEALRRTAEERIGRLSRYLDGMDRAEVHLYEERNPRIADKRDVCEVTVEGHGHHVRAKVAAPDPFAAVDAAAHKLEHQLHKLKTKLIGRSHPRRNGATSAASTNGHGPPALLADDGEEGDQPALVRSKRFATKPMTVDEAIMQLDLLGHDFYLFHNADSGRSGVVYHRRAGGYGLIEQE